MRLWSEFHIKVVVKLPVKDTSVLSCTLYTSYTKFYTNKRYETLQPFIHMEKVEGGKMGDKQGAFHLLSLY